MPLAREHRWYIPSEELGRDAEEVAGVAEGACRGRGRGGRDGELQSRRSEDGGAAGATGRSSSRRGGRPEQQSPGRPAGAAQGRGWPEQDDGDGDGRSASRGWVGAAPCG